MASAEKCPPALKAKMIGMVNESESFDETGLSLKILDLTEFWVGQDVLGSSHPQWEALSQTTLESCLCTVDQLYTKKKSGQALNAPKVHSLAKRLALYMNIKTNVFPRLSDENKSHPFLD